MTSPLPPRLRDTRALADLVRQNRQNAKQLGVGFVGGRFSPAKPLGATEQDGDLEDDTADDVEQMAGWNTDYAVCTTAGRITLPLTYAPIDGTLHVRWDGDDLRPAEYVLAGQSVIFTDPHIHVDDVLDAEYFYWPNDVPVVSAPLPATATLRGATSNGAVNGDGMTSLPLPDGTLVGDLIVVSFESSGTANMTFDDDRLTAVDTLYIGFATDLSDIAVTATGGFGSRWAIACITLDTNAVGWSAPSTVLDSTMVTGDTLAIPAVSGYGAAVCALRDGHDTTSGFTSLPTGYASGANSSPALSHARVNHWDNGGVLGTSPTGPTTFSGGDGYAWCTVVGLIGPTEDK